MWRNHEYMLRLYTQTCIDEWLRRGYKNTIALPMPADVGTVPPWLGNKQFHSSHRSNLLRKDPTFYSQFGWSDSPDAPYWWPI